MYQDNNTIVMRATGRPRRIQRRLSPHIDAHNHHKAEGAAARSTHVPEPDSVITKNVRFNLYCEHGRKYRCPPSPLVSANPSDIWYTKKDYNKMKQRETHLIKELARTFPNTTFAVDGVESVEYRRRKIERVQKARQCVLRLQNLPQDAFATIYGRITGESAKHARRKAMPMKSSQFGPNRKKKEKKSETILHVVIFLIFSLTLIFSWNNLENERATSE
jgi:hypothetical protein